MYGLIKHRINMDLFVAYRYYCIITITNFGCTLNLGILLLHMYTYTQYVPMYSIMGTCVVYPAGSLKGGVGYIKINSYVKLMDIVYTRNDK